VRDETQRGRSVDVERSLEEERSRESRRSVEREAREYTYRGGEG
jgi:hypothetical protein